MHILSKPEMIVRKMYVRKYMHCANTLVYVRVLHSQTCTYLLSLLHGGSGQVFHCPVLFIKLKRGAFFLSSFTDRIGQTVSDIRMTQPILGFVGSDVRQRKRGRGYIRWWGACGQICLVCAGLFTDANVLDT